MGSWKPVVATLDAQSIIAAYKSGAAVLDIAKTHGVRDYHVRAVLRKAGIAIIKGRFSNGYVPHNKTTVSTEAIITLVNQGYEWSQIAAELNCTVAVVRQRCYKFGIKSPGFTFREATNLRNQIGDQAYDKLSDKVWLYTEYVTKYQSTRKIGQLLGCGKKAVVSALRRHAISIRRGPSKSGRYKSTTTKCSEFWCDSSWEWHIALKLDADIMVLKFIKEPFPIRYLDGQKQRLYYPDFLVFLTDGRSILLEVKPDPFLPFVEAKTRAAKDSGFDYHVINIDDEFPWRTNG